MPTPVQHRAKNNFTFDPNYSSDKCKPKRILFTVEKGCGLIVHGFNYEGCEYMLVRLGGKCGTVMTEVLDGSGEPVLANADAPSFVLVAPGRYMLKPVENGANYLLPEFTVDKAAMDQLKTISENGAAYGL